MERKILRIEKIYIERLYNTFDYVITLNLEDRITIIHGPNGYGKTTILDLIFELFSGDPAIFYKIPFLRIDITYVNKSQLLIERSFVESPNIGFSMPTNQDMKPFDLRELTFGRDFLSSKEYKDIRLTAPITTTTYSLARLAKEISENKDLKEFRHWLNSYEQIRNEYRYKASIRHRHKTKEELDFPRAEWFLSEIRPQTQVEFIRTDRLFTFIKPDQISETIIKFSDDLVELIQDARNDYNDLTTSIDRSFPFRIIKGQHIPPEKDIQEMLEDLETKRSRLSSVGLIDQEQDSELLLQEFQGLKINNEYQRSVLSIYVEDAKRKLEVFDLILTKISLFRRIINHRLLNKELYINKKRGFVITTPEGKELSLKDLSSGEKHQIIIFYKLIFNTEPNTLVLIDEPEISLHVDWQEEFIPDILEVAKLNNLDILIATHSPTIIGDRWDLTIPLEGPESK